MNYEMALGKCIKCCREILTDEVLTAADGYKYVRSLCPKCLIQYPEDENLFSPLILIKQNMKLR
jgi:hypothetical protein